MFVIIRKLTSVNIHLKILYVVSRKSAETLHTRRIHTSHRVGVASDKGGGAGGETRKEGKENRKSNALPVSVGKLN